MLGESDAAAAPRTGGSPMDSTRASECAGGSTRASVERYLRARKAVAEPVNGQVKHVRRFRQFSIRSVQAVDAEWAKVSLCHDVLDRSGHRVAGPPPAWETHTHDPVEATGG